MKSWPFLAILLGVVAVWFVMNRTWEPFVPEFLDQGNVKRTTERSASSYDQETNHFKMTPNQQEPIQGVETPFRVNMYNSYMV